MLIGGQGSDFMIGGSGNDILYGDDHDALWQQVAGISSLSSYGILAHFLGNNFFANSLFTNSFSTIGAGFFNQGVFSFGGVNGSTFVQNIFEQLIFRFTTGTQYQFQSFGPPSFHHDTLIGGSGHDQLYGGVENDWLYGNQGSDQLTGGQGQDYIDGGAGVDTTVFSGSRTDYFVTQLQPNVFQIQDTLAGRDGVDTVKNVELFKFADGVLTADQILNTQINDPPIVANPIANQNATEDQAFTFSVPADTFNDEEDGNALTLSATLANGDPLPAWLSFDLLCSVPILGLAIPSISLIWMEPTALLLMVLPLLILAAGP